MARFYSSDTHFGHQNVIRYCDRPFKSVDEMNMTMVSKWNEVVTNEDTVIFVGDFSLSLGPVQTFTPMLNGYKILVSGNHDMTHPSHKKSKGGRREEMVKKYLDYGWAEVHTRMDIQLANRAVTVCHLPFSNPNLAEDDQRHMAHRPKDRGQILICGHVHQYWTVRERMINVGVDRWDFKPVPEETIVKIIKEKMTPS